MGAEVVVFDGGFEDGSGACVLLGSIGEEKSLQLGMAAGVEESGAAGFGGGVGSGSVLEQKAGHGDLAAVRVRAVGEEEFDERQVTALGDVGEGFTSVGGSLGEGLLKVGVIAAESGEIVVIRCAAAEEEVGECGMMGILRPSARTASGWAPASRRAVTSKAWPPMTA